MPRRLHWTVATLYCCVTWALWCARKLNPCVRVLRLMACVLHHSARHLFCHQSLWRRTLSNLQRAHIANLFDVSCLVCEELTDQRGVIKWRVCLLAIKSARVAIESRYHCELCPSHNPSKSAFVKPQRMSESKDYFLNSIIELNTLSTSSRAPAYRLAEKAGVIVSCLCCWCRRWR